MTRKKQPAAGKPKKQVKSLPVDRKAEDVRGGFFREPTKHPAKVTVPDVKF